MDDEGVSANDLRAVLDFLCHRKTTDEISRAIRALAPVKTVKDYAALAQRGFGEIRARFHDKATRSNRQAAGLAGAKR